MERSDQIIKAKKIVQQLLANIEGRSSQIDASYSIADRSISKMTLDELTQQYDWWSRRLDRLEADQANSENIAAGKKSNRNILARFSA